MANHKSIYDNESNMYEDMIARQPDMLEIIRDIRPVEGLDVLDLGAGTGRLAATIAPRAQSVVCTDVSSAMLERLDQKLNNLSIPKNWSTCVADHRELPLADASVDLVVSGWSICYLTHSGIEDGPKQLERILQEIERVLKPQGTVIIIETLGTGTTTPAPPDFLESYFSLLEKHYEFSHRWIRMDYSYDHPQQAVEMMTFFFGDELAARIKEHQWSTVPECAGIWYKHYK
ncbi:type 11 methyltransferase [Paenibacillus algicola]|uniref:Type 11 methyltransferase n=1 Tax=Paenibacillus algicola TaxID=2565926 RepID=A0A4P8XP43_9BACL|nr:class I SAM-dependent methyltransferase [Paenibacillus algicola]QCT03401.1 type 11 methyltransferase [Paenibacillus algicola]